MDLIVHQLNTVFHEAPQCWAWAEKFGFEKRFLSKKGVCPTLEEQLEKVKNNLAANDLITDKLAGHIYDALVKTAKELHTLEGEAAHDRFVELMSDDGKYEEAPKEIMDLIVHQLNTVFHEAPQCWAWAEKFGFEKRFLSKKGVCPTLEEQLEKVKNNLAANDLITDKLAGHIYHALVKVAKELHTLEGKAAHDRFVELMSDGGKYKEAPKEIMDLIVHQLNTVLCGAWAKKYGFDKRGACPTEGEIFAKLKNELSSDDKITGELAGHIVNALRTVLNDQGTLEGAAAHEQFLDIMSDGGKYTEAPKAIMDVIVHHLKNVFHPVAHCF